jgi:hypothetical protein
MPTTSSLGISRPDPNRNLQPINSVRPPNCPSNINSNSNSLAKELGDLKDLYARQDKVIQQLQQQINEIKGDGVML